MKISINKVEEWWHSGRSNEERLLPFTPVLRSPECERKANAQIMKISIKGRAPSRRGAKIGVRRNKRTRVGISSRPHRHEHRAPERMRASIGLDRWRRSQVLDDVCHHEQMPGAGRAHEVPGRCQNGQKVCCRSQDDYRVRVASSYSMCVCVCARARSAVGSRPLDDVSETSRS